MDLAAQLVAGHKKKSKEAVGDRKREDVAEIVGQEKWLHWVAVNDL